MENFDSTAVVLFQLGGPDNTAAVEPFLYNLFCDPDIIDIPGAFLFRRRLARLISSRRAPKVAELYRHIGGKSPILEQTQEQANALKKYLESRNIGMPVYIMMRYWHPMTVAVVDQLVKDGIRKLILTPLYPHYSRATTGSGLNELKRVLKRENLDERINYELIESYFVHPLYIESLVERINETLLRFPEPVRDSVHLVFSAHGTPLKLVREGDPYSHQIRATYEAVMKRGNYSHSSVLCFQSKVGPQRWLEPSLIQTIDKLGREGVKHMLVIPVAFVSDHLETLSEIAIDGRKQAASLGVEGFEVMPALKDYPLFIQCLGELVLEKLNRDHERIS